MCSNVQSDGSQHLKTVSVDSLNKFCMFAFNCEGAAVRGRCLCPLTVPQKKKKRKKKEEEKQAAQIC